MNKRAPGVTIAKLIGHFENATRKDTVARRMRSGKYFFQQGRQKLQALLN
jgi:hypothetical protein